MATLSITKLWSEARKAVIAGVGALANVVSLGILHGTASHVAAIIITVATAIGVYSVPNKPAS